MKGSGFRLVHAKQHFEERGFSGAILADQCVNFAGEEFKPDIVERFDARPALRHAFKQQQRLLGLSLHRRASSRHELSVRYLYRPGFTLLSLSKYWSMLSFVINCAG